MSKDSLEHLSSLMDGELSRDTGLFLTRRLSSDEALSESWERFHLIRDCIRQPGSKVVVTGLCGRFTETLNAEEDFSAQSSGQSRWLKPVSGLAIAASVALVAIMVTAPPTGTVVETANEATLSADTNQPFVSPNTLPLAPVSQAASFGGSTAGNERLNAYLLRHNQMARTAGRQGFVSFVPIVATSTEDATDPDSGTDSVNKDKEPENTENR